jgi:hypothetical protein
MVLAGGQEMADKCFAKNRSSEGVANQNALVT